MKFSQDQVLKTFENTGVMHVIPQADPEAVKEILDALYSAGVRVFELHHREGNFMDIFEKIKFHAQQYSDLLLGAGSIFSDEDAKKILGVGADFIVSPAFIPTVGVYCNSKQVLWIPGCGTLTEVYNAVELGAQLIRVFPAHVMGPSFITAVKEIFPQIRLIFSGELEPSERNLATWFGAGVTCIETITQKFPMRRGIDPGRQEQIVQVLNLIKKIKQS